MRLQRIFSFCLLPLLLVISPLTAAQSGSLAQGMAAFEADQFGEAARILRPLAERGDVEAQFTLGYMYYMGTGVPQSKSTAVRWYKKAADQGDPTAKYNLGYLYLYGDGVTEDRGKAISLFRAAAAQGQLLAMLGMGLIFETAKFSPPDYARALDWYQRAEREGLASASTEVRRLRSWMDNRRRTVRGTNVNLRAEPNTRSTIITTVSAPEKMYELSRSGDWLKVQFEGGKRTQGWLHQDLVGR